MGATTTTALFLTTPFSERTQTMMSFPSGTFQLWNCAWRLFSRLSNSFYSKPQPSFNRARVRRWKKLFALWTMCKTRGGCSLSLSLSLSWDATKLGRMFCSFCMLRWTVIDRNVGSRRGSAHIHSDSFTFWFAVQTTNRWSSGNWLVLVHGHALLISYWDETVRWPNETVCITASLYKGKKR